MDHPALALVLPSLLLVPAMGLLSRIQSTTGTGAEIRRKALHVGTGLLAMTFPILLTSPWSVLCAACLVVAWMLAVRLHPGLRMRFGCVLHAAGRRSWGELYFAGAITGLLLASGSNTALYVIPLLILTIADALAAVVGRTWPFGALPAPAAGKTLSGFAAFSVAAFLVTVIGLHSLTTLDNVQIVALSLVVTLLTAVVEAVCRNGFDNLAVPAVAWIILYAVPAGV